MLRRTTDPPTPITLTFLAMASTVLGLSTPQPAAAQHETFKTERSFDRFLGDFVPAERQTTGVLELYAIDDGHNDHSGTLFRIGMTAIGEVVDVELVGETGIENIWDIAFIGDRLFGMTGTFDELVEINPKNGLAVVLEDFNIPSQPNALIAESPTTLLTVTSALGEVWRIDVEQLTATLVGEYGNDYNSSGDLAFDNQGRLFGTVERGQQLTDILVEVDPTDGSATPIGDLMFQEVYGLAFARNTQILYGVVEAERFPKLVTIDRSTGLPTVVGEIPVPNGLTGLAISSVLFVDHFETGDTGAWSLKQP